jgi:hypothetical protein
MMWHDYGSDGVRLERTGWRCQAISQRHRQWGYNCPCVDLDFVVAEYNHGKPVAIVEYKDKHAQPPDLGHPTYKALAELSDGYRDGPLPFFIATYCSLDWWFVVTPINDRAKAYYGKVAGQPLTEQRFVKSLYLLRKKSLDDEDMRVIERLNAIMPDIAA